MAPGREIGGTGRGTLAAVVSLYWLSFESARHPRQDAAGAGMARGVYQVLMLVAPFLQAEGRLLLERLAQEYLVREEGG